MLCGGTRTQIFPLQSEWSYLAFLVEAILHCGDEQPGVMDEMRTPCHPENVQVGRLEGTFPFHMHLSQVWC